MKNILILFAAAVASLSAGAQVNQVDQQPKTSTTVSPGTAMLDGKAFAVTVTENAPTTGVDKKTMTSESAMDNPDLTQPKHADQASDMNSKDGRKMIIRFESGMVRTSAKGNMKVEKCPYNSSGTASTGISFTASCESTGSSSMNNKNSSSSVNNPAPASNTDHDNNIPDGGTSSDNTMTSKTQLAGTVNGNSINGTMTCTKKDGTIKTYSYTGRTASRNELDMEGETGMK